MSYAEERGPQAHHQLRTLLHLPRQVPRAHRVAVPRGEEAVEVRNHMQARRQVPPLVRLPANQAV
jgi:hypothetical protein